MASPEIFLRPNSFDLLLHIWAGHLRHCRLELAFLDQHLPISWSLLDSRKRYWCQHLGSESCFKEPGVLIYRWNSNSFWRKSWWKARDGSWEFTASDAYPYFFLVQGCHVTLLPRSVAWRLQKPAANDTTTLVKTLGTLTQQLVKLRHLPSPFPSRCSVDLMHSSFNSTQSALLGGEGDSRNSPL